jgi:membrane associated rhomboid family serine protease
MKDNNITHVAVQRKLRSLTQSGLFLAVLLAVQMLGLPNPVTGVLINAILIFVSLHLGVRYALILSTLSPIGGVVSGHLPAPLYPLIPVIVCGNYLLVLGYRIFLGRSAALRMVFPALAKGALIGFAGLAIIRILKITATGGWVLLPVLGLQFFTALAGTIGGERIFLQVNRQEFLAMREDARPS